MLQPLPDSTNITAPTIPAGYANGPIRVVVYRAESTLTGGTARTVMVASDALTKRAELSAVMERAAVLEVLEVADQVATVLCQFPSFDWSVRPREKPPLPPHKHFDHKKFAQRRGFQQMARLPCYRGARTR